MKRPAVLLLMVLAACSPDTVSPPPPPGPEPADIINRLPEAAATDVSVGTVVRIEFGWPVVLPFYPENTIWLEQDTTRIAVTLVCPDSQTVELVPLDVLDPGVTYTVHVGPGIIRHGGLIAADSWTFTTGGRPPPRIEDPLRLLAHVSALADDSMRGRSAGSEEELKAAGYIQTEFERYGLVPFPDSGWMQVVPGDGFLGTSQNVIGVLPGQGSLTDQWVVVGAHYDHLGVRAGQIYNGADDNASGTAAVLELARTLARYTATDGFGSADRRSLMFIAFGAEERGLIGSCYFARVPFMPLSTIVAMLNLDMIGRMRNDSVYVAGIDSGQEWPALLQRYRSTLDYRSVNSATDYRCFQNRGIPVISLTTGGHPQYHTPEDDTELINPQGMADVGDLALGLLFNLAVRARGPTPPE